MARRGDLGTGSDSIRAYFEDATVFITGATGFLGQLLFEKLLRTCDVRRVYLLIRPKGGRSVSERLDALLEDQMFDRMKNERPNFMEKIVMVRGECALPDLGLNCEDRKILVDEVSCVFHCAGAINLDEKLKTAAYVNVRTVRDLLRMSREMRNLKSLVHVSSAYAHSPRGIVEEEFYKPYLTCDELLTFVDALDAPALDKITSTLVGRCANNYTFTKAVAEHTVETDGIGLPVAIVRPSMVIATAKEPIAGWIDNLYGPTGLLVASNLGITRSTLANPDFLADVVPADFVVNVLLAASWRTANLQSLNENKESVGRGRRIEEEIPIYNVVSSTETPITWKNFIGLSKKHASRIPSTLLVSHDWNKINSNETVHYLYVLLLHYLPGVFLDFLAFCIGRSPLLLLTYKKIDEFTEVFKYFTLNQWFFRNRNTQELWKSMCASDRQSFEFDMSSLHWDLYCYNYMRGVRIYVLKDPLDTVLSGCRKYFKLKVFHQAVVLGLCVLIYKLARKVFEI